jgi:hypothetical protein
LVCGEGHSNYCWDDYDDDFSGWGVEHFSDDAGVFSDAAKLGSDGD